ncbi:hypothetical protein DPMN_181800 [Dreissena polymorpha]|uniref:Uncharacterized protein n=1 Tax=Dreissena polymorpha TaxID=45954 RepID=A0A9D4DF41_DREPO|nr:hypothetical protein DPMN_181800 [Dreissena polymorpha]
MTGPVTGQQPVRSTVMSPVLSCHKSGPVTGRVIDHRSCHRSGHGPVIDDLFVVECIVFIKE